ncbi:type II secretion system minor pseudopilin GspJ [Zobellella sp. DQSA1]|uniref:type II secretion system minor pseudopilin GspJ n=1 Tax=Zobellella sp. DQSA1 TaxID=3342386 RepID=UPI0035BF78D3
MRQRGFTLIEVLLALAIFAALSAGAFQVLQGMVRSDEVSQRKAQRLMELHGAFSQLETDISQMIPRLGRGNGRMLHAARYQLQSEDWAASFTRSGWHNPLGLLHRSELQSVAYRLRHHRLERLSYRHVDPVVGEEPRITPVLQDVTAFRLRFFSRGGWHDRWDHASQLPRAVEVTLELPDLGEVSRLFLLTPGAAQ